MKKIVSLGLSTVLSIELLTGCGGNGGKEIIVISREDGSGTRGAFVELFGVEEKDENGNKTDKTVETAEITNNTSVMMTTVAGSERAIGYISLGSLNNTVKPVKIDGVEPTVQNIQNGKYTVARPFNIATKEKVNEQTQDFINFIMSVEGQDIVEKKGYVRVKATGEFKGGKVSGKVTVVGSSSVTPVMEALKEAYHKLNQNVSVEVQQNDSSTGMTATIDGICDIGMASREVKDSELQKGLKATTIAQDGIVVIVSKGSMLENLTKEQVKDIYTGKVTTWEQLMG